ncbi:hypothetical protein CTA1_9082 [Colletotrichum tanaceti]|uniref:Uncharacterized protein n=1 Tax=Colletotrichum tanaceti TaxID=1306861 RepID=A0A4U6XN48_9PEZI|nr:hypothetical protein CTA1_9082 [Colletotrichum tanaceti]
MTEEETRFKIIRDALAKYSITAARELPLPVGDEYVASNFDRFRDPAVVSMPAKASCRFPITINMVPVPAIRRGEKYHRNGAANGPRPA